MLHEKFRMLHSNFDTIDGGTSIVVMLSRARIESEAALFNMSSLQLFQRTFHSSASTSTIKDAKPVSSIQLKVGVGCGLGALNLLFLVRPSNRRERIIRPASIIHLPLVVAILLIS